MRFLQILGLSAIFAATSANPLKHEPSVDHIVNLNARGGSATGCVQAHCTMIQESTLTSKSINYQIYWNGQKIFTCVIPQQPCIVSMTSLIIPLCSLSGKPSSDLQWNGLTDSKGRKWGFKSGGDCESLAYLNNFQSNYDYYQLTRTSRASSKHDCPPCIEKANGKVSCGKCTDYESIFSDGPSGQCYGYSGLSTCDFRVTC